MKHLTVNLFILLLWVGAAYGQTRTITGSVVSSAEGAPIEGATVSIRETNQAVVTDANGRFSISGAPLQGTLVVSYVGAETIEVPLTASADYPVVLKSSSGELGEVVVTALGITREKKALGYSIQELKGEELAEARDPNILNALSGKVAGVQITSGGSTVGSSSRITIRGNASFGNNTPLFVVDGIPINNSSTDLGGAGGIDYGNVTADLDPNNIESLTVLKGATASALYGSRATNGVILITTKKGSTSKKLGVDVSTSAILDQPAYFLKFQNEYGGGLNGGEYIWKRDHSEMSYQDYAKQYAYNYVDGLGGGVNDSWPINWGPRMDAGLLLDQWSTGPNSPYVSRPDNIKDFFRTGTSYEHFVSVTSSGKNASGRLAYTNANTNGIVDNTDQTQRTLTASFTLTPTDKLSVNTNITYVNKHSDNIPRNGYSGAIVDLSWTQRDIDTRYMKEVFEKQGNSGYIFPDGDNMFYSLRNTNSLSRERVYGNVDLNYQFAPWISALARVGSDFYNEFRKSITQAGTSGNIRNKRGGQFNQTELYNSELNADLILKAEKSFSRFAVDALVGANYRNVKYRSMYMSAPDLTVPDVYNISNVKGTPGFSNYDSEKETNSLYASANLSYNDYLFLGVTGRNDWSSSLPPAAWSYFYPSVSLGLVLTDALNIKSSELSYAKLRASWAKVGGDTGPYRLDRTYSASTFNGISLFRPTGTMPPVGLKPEETDSYEFGLELSLLKDRINLDIAYYDQTTVNQILAVTTSIASGYRSQLLNAGEIQNKGVEIMLGAKIINQPNGFSWNANINWARNKNMVNELYSGLLSYPINSGFGGATIMAFPGEEWGIIYGLDFVRNVDGKVVVGENGIPLTSNTPSRLGKVNPEWIGGIRNAFQYKRVSLNFLIDVRMGSQFFSTTAWHAYYTGSFENTIQNNVRETGIIVDAVTEDNKPNTVRVAAQDYYGGEWIWNNHQYSILDGSFVKFRELTLGYQLNVGKIKGISGATISLFGRNLAILYRDKSTRELGIDPEVGFGGGDAGVGLENFQIPTTRNLGAKLSISF